MKIRIIGIILFSIFILCLFTTNTLAHDVKDGAGGSSSKSVDVTSTINPDDWNPSGTGKESEDLNKMVGKILGTIRNAGIIISVIALMVIGLKTMFGSLEEKSHYKELLPTFVIGVFIFLSCTTIPDMIYRVLKS